MVKMLVIFMGMSISLSAFATTVSGIRVSCVDSSRNTIERLVDSVEHQNGVLVGYKIQADGSKAVVFTAGRDAKCSIAHVTWEE